MRALSFTSPEDVELVERPTPAPAAGESLIRVESSAICGSELHSDPGTNPGHEAAGIVEHAPDGSGFRSGERVGLSAVTGCGTCDQCRRGVQLFCERGCRIHVRMHAEYIAVPVEALRRLPEGTSARDAVLVTGDTLGVPVRAQRRLPSGPGDRVLVVGLGPVGLGHTMVRAHAGAEVVAIEPSEYRRELAMKLGAAEVLEPGDDIGPLPGLAIECTGLPDCIRLALTLVDVGGTVLQSGECPAVEVSPSDVFIRREITYTGGWYYADEDFPEMVRLYETGLPVERLATHEFPADRVADAYRTFVSKESGKVLLRWV
jgi:threonine dehydrogenase-like Zn-dependent dehydrogenase